MMGMDGTVVAVSRSDSHSFSKQNQESIELVAAYGIEGDVHAGATIKHRSRLAKEGDQPNIRQVHLLHTEIFEELKEQGYEVLPGELGENITTKGLDILAMPKGTRLHIGSSAIVELTGLRNPCGQIDDFQKGLKDALLDHDAEGNLIRKSGVMSIVIASGDVVPGDPIRVELPPLPHERMERV